ncbi:ATP-binding protein [Streptomyces sp. NPDC046931]|uniref:ATP-binding protein n=1 Tax=Streptomyces sp. NPDC046931 TaxID=3154806 RepID=UPI0033FD35E7
MDPNNEGPEEYGHDGDHAAPRQRPPRDLMTSDFGQPAPALARTVQLVTGDFLVTVNPVDGSEIEACTPGRRPERPVKRTAADRADKARAAKPPVPAGPGRPQQALLKRQEERERLVRLLARGRSVRLTGPSGSGRTALLDIVAEDCADLAPDGVIRLCGYRRTTNELLYDLFAAVYDAPLFRPDRDELVRYLQDIGAVVVLDDLEFGGSALDELLDATPECAFLLSATPDVPAPSADSRVEEVFLGGLDRAAGLELLERAVGRDLTEDEANWAGDLWFESEGLPLRFMQAGALLRQRDRQRAEEDAVDEFGVFQNVPSAKASSEQAEGPAPGDAADGPEVPLPSLAEAAAAAPLLASRLSASARETLKFAVALGGEVPHQTHLPALVDDTHADAALAELADCALVSPVGSRYRLAAGVPAQLEAAGYATGAEEYALKAAQHYCWWAGHPSVTPARVVAEADAVLAALAALAPVSTRLSNSSEQVASPASSGEDEEGSVAVRLARQAAPAFAAGLDWGAWERALRSGTEVARSAGEVVEQAYFHHELGILALCTGQIDRSRAELEASIGLRGALADKRGTVAGRRALALVGDRARTAPLVVRTAAAGEAPDARQEEPASRSGGGVPGGFGPSAPAGDTATLVAHQVPAKPVSRLGGVRGAVTGTRRNLVAAGAGAALVAVLGTVVTLGMTSNSNGNAPSDQVRVGPSATEGPNDDSLGADKAGGDSDGGGASGATGAAPTPTNPGPDGAYGTSDDPTPRSTGGVPVDEPTSKRPTVPSKSPTRPTSRPTTRPTTPTTPTTKPSTPSGSPSPTSTTPSPSSSGPTPPVSNSASGPASSSAPASTSGSASAPQSSGSGTPGGERLVI